MRVYQTTPPGPLTAINSFIPSAPGGQILDTRDGAPGSPASAARYMPSSSLHTVVIVEMPPLADVIKALEDDALPTPNNPPKLQHSEDPNSESSPPAPPPQPMPAIAGRSLPLLFIRSSDGVGYHSGRTIACENVFQAIDLGSMAGNQGNGPPGTMDANWIAAAQAAAAADGGLHGWTLRVM
jgi:recombining binding protein (suppressor of hairless)